MARLHDHEARLAELVSHLAVAETTLSAAQTALKEKEAEVQAILLPFQAAKASAQDQVDALRSQIKSEGLLVDKENLHPALSLKDITHITYDEAAMFQWCVMFNPSLLELNRGNITQHVNWILGLKSQSRKFFGTDGKKPLVPMPITVEKVPTIQIGGNLSAWLPGDVSDPPGAEPPPPPETDPPPPPESDPGSSPPSNPPGEEDQAESESDPPVTHHDEYEPKDPATTE